jgi:hypothetical protein
MKLLLCCLIAFALAANGNEADSLYEQQDALFQTVLKVKPTLTQAASESDEMVEEAEEAADVLQATLTEEEKGLASVHSGNPFDFELLATPPTTAAHHSKQLADPAMPPGKPDPAFTTPKRQLNDPPFDKSNPAVHNAPIPPVVASKHPTPKSKHPTPTPSPPKSLGGATYRHPHLAHTVKRVVRHQHKIYVREAKKGSEAPTAHKKVTAVKKAFSHPVWDKVPSSAGTAAIKKVSGLSHIGNGRWHRPSKKGKGKRSGGRGKGKAKAMSFLEKKKAKKKERAMRARLRFVYGDNFLENMLAATAPIHPLAKPGSNRPTHALHSGKAKREDAKEPVHEAVPPSNDIPSNDIWEAAQVGSLHRATRHVRDAALATASLRMHKGKQKKKKVSIQRTGTGVTFVRKAHAFVPPLPYKAPGARRRRRWKRDGRFNWSVHRRYGWVKHRHHSFEYTKPAAGWHLRTQRNFLKGFGPKRLPRDILPAVPVVRRRRSDPFVQFTGTSRRRLPNNHGPSSIQKTYISAKEPCRKDPAMKGFRDPAFWKHGGKDPAFNCDE